jgi:hypothetical protein
MLPVISEATDIIKIKEREIQHIYVYGCMSNVGMYSESNYITSYWFARIS